MPQNRTSKANSAKVKCSSALYAVALVLIILLGVFLAYLFYYGPSTANVSDNFLYADYAHQIYVGHAGSLPSNDVLAQQYLLLAGIAAFYAAFGVASPFTASLFGVLCFALTIAIIYKIGALLYGRGAGLVSALVYSFNPVAVINASYVGDNGPMALFASACVLFLILGMQEKRVARSGTYFLLSGFSAMIGVLVTVQSAEILVFVAPFALFYAIREKSTASLLNIGLFALGIAIAVACTALVEFSIGNPPLLVFSLNYNAYSAGAGHTPQIGNYTRWLFPANPASQLNPAQAAYSSGMSSGLYGYAALLGAVYLLFRRNFRFFVPAFWSVSTLLYMGYGSLSLLDYVPISYSRVRFMLIFIPALALIIGFSLLDMAEILRKNRLKILGLLLPGLIVIALFINSAGIIQFVGLSQYKHTYQLSQTGSFLLGLPADVPVYGNIEPLDVYAHYKPNFVESEYDFFPPFYFGSNCSMLAVPNASVAKICGLREAFASSQPPAYLDAYRLFDNDSFRIYENITVYYKAA
ncbi:MAG: glycosyltransferase family 39 protein [Candidatus Micrarchaeota archaeon]|nr:glycosyltransferase family 39 protein [Candidatus Micrarchaeota archaeon]